jgi:hypothetical protein
MAFINLNLNVLSIQVSHFPILRQVLKARERRSAWS